MTTPGLEYVATLAIEVGAPLDRTLPPWLKDLSEIALDKQADDTAWARGAVAAALKELYGAPWSTTGPARTSNLSSEIEREAE